MSETLGTYDNRPTPALVALYQRWAASDLGLILTGNVMVDRRALGEPGNVAIEDESDLALLTQWARAATSRGAAIWAQLNHPGKQSTKGLNAYNIAPSAVPFREDMAAFFETPRAATQEEIEDVIRRFGRSAAVCKKAGFGGVQIHGAHGYLVSQFLSPGTTCARTHGAARRRSAAASCWRSMPRSAARLGLASRWPSSSTRPTSNAAASPKRSRWTPSAPWLRRAST